MKGTTLQIGGWWGVDVSAASLLLQISNQLQSAGFTVSSNSEVGRRRTRPNEVMIFGWDRVSLGSTKSWFAFVSGAEGPWMNLKLRIRSRGQLKIVSAVFEQIVEELRPEECVLWEGNPENFPIWARPSIDCAVTRCVNLDRDPPVVVTRGDPDWYRVSGPELRFLSSELLAQNQLVPESVVAEPGQFVSVISGGVCLDGGWTQRWSS